MSKRIEQSVKEKLKNISKAEGIAFNILLETLFFERFMVRLANSKFRENVIFKGGMCLDQYLDLGRETRDLDFLLRKIDSDINKVKEILDEVISEASNDGIQFAEVEVDLLSLEHKKYPGYRMSIIGILGQIKQRISIDIGVGDVVRPRLLEVELLKDKGPLFESAISVNAYPPDYIFAEKLEAIIHLGESNGRMKDFFDCYKIIQEVSIPKDDFKEAIHATFANRGTKVTLIPEVVDELKTRWAGFIRKNKIAEMELEFVVSEINKFLIDIGVKKN